VPTRINIMNLDNIISFLTSIPHQLQENILWVKLAFFGISGIFLGIMIFVLTRTNWLRYLFIEDLVGFFTYKPYGAVRITRRWERITKRLELGSEDEYKTAVLEAEEMLDDVLKKLGYPGENLKERLEKVTPTTVSNIDQLYQALQTRNDIVYNPDFRLSSDQAKKTLAIFEQALRDLQVF